MKKISESSSISNEDGNERKLEQWSESDDNDCNAVKIQKLINFLTDLKIKLTNLIFTKNSIPF